MDPQRSFAVDVVRRLRKAGHEALWAGGCVRDALLGKTPKDYDVATDAQPDRVRALFGKRQTVPVGAAFGVMTVLGPRGVSPIEVATFRTDGSYSDGRRPDAVRFSNAEEDASRRDFTINGLFYDPLDNRVIDYVGGQADLELRIVRAIGNAEERIAEDRLRMLRAVRFAATLGFALDEATLAAVRKSADQISVVSAERIGAELKRMLTNPRAADALRLLATTELLPEVLPEADPSAGSERLARIAQRASPDETSASLGLAAVLLGKASPGAGTAAARRLKWTAKEAEATGWLLENTDRLAPACAAAWSALQPLLAGPKGPDLVRLYAATDRALVDVIEHCQERLAWPADRLDPVPLVVGADLIAAGLKPGPRFSEYLREARAAQLDGVAATKQAALALLGLD